MCKDWDKRSKEMEADSKFMLWLNKFDPDWELEPIGYALCMHDGWLASNSIKMEDLTEKVDVMDAFIQESHLEESFKTWYNLRNTTK